METDSSDCLSTVEEAAPATPSTSSGRIVVRIRLQPPWTPEEDACLERLAKANGFRHWRRVASEMPMPPWQRRRSARHCRDRWREHLARDVYHRPFTPDDDAELAFLRLRGAGGGDSWKDVSRAAYCRTSRVMRRRWRELRKSDAFLGALYGAQPPADQEAGMDAAMDDAPTHSDVLTSSVASYSAGCGAVASGGNVTAVAPRFACLAV
uniref:Myb-like domain-containing protein n=1 Tax=Leersia perrieri TaxID=77586 RepID=A0A0D9UY63_9ORYZ